MMPLQRTRDAENRVRNKLSNGPLRAQSNGNIQSILRRIRQTSNAGDMLVSYKAHDLYREFKVAPRIRRFVLDKMETFCQGFFI